MLQRLIDTCLAFYKSHRCNLQLKLNCPDCIHHILGSVRSQHNLWRVNKIYPVYKIPKLVYEQWIFGFCFHAEQHLYVIFVWLIMTVKLFFVICIKLVCMFSVLAMQIVMVKLEYCQQLFQQETFGQIMAAAVSTNLKVVWSSTLHVKLSLGKILNPQLPPLECERQMLGSKCLGIEKKCYFITEKQNCVLLFPRVQR